MPLPDSGGSTNDREWFDDITPERIVEELPLVSGGYPDMEFQSIVIEGKLGGRQLVGRGASALVYAGTTRTGRRVAVKVFNESEDLIAQGDAVGKEWRAAQHRYSRHVVVAYACYLVETGLPAPQWILVMELLSGGSLKDVLERVKAGGYKVSPHTQALWLSGGLEGLTALEEAQHQLRDIKPANIGLDDPVPEVAQPVFLDHGVAQRHGTRSQLLGGTPQYAAPELLLGANRELLNKADVFSFGAALLDVLTGGRGFAVADGGDLAPTLTASPRLDDPSVSAATARILRGALVKDPRLRPTASELLSLLQAPAESTPEWDPEAPFTSWASGKRDESAPDAQGRGSSPRVPGSGADLPGRPRPVRVRELDRPSAGSLPVTLMQLDLDVEGLEDRATETADRGRFLEWFAGVDSRYVKERSDRFVYGLLGVILMVYFGYATAATAMLVRLATNIDGPLTWTIGALIGATVAIVVINIDRSIMAASSVELDRLDDAALDQNPLKKNLAPSVWVRIIIAILFALVVGEAANQALFANDIEAKLAADLEIAVEGKADEIRADYEGSLGAASAAKALAEQNVIAYQQKIDDAQARADGEANGTYGTMSPGCEEQCMLHVAEANNLLAGQLAYEADQNAAVTSANTQIADLELKIQNATEQARDELSANTGPIAHEQALWSLLLSDPGMLARFGVVTLLLLFIDLAAVTIKLATRQNNYERTRARALRQSERVDQLRHGIGRDAAHRRARGNSNLLAAADRAFYSRQSPR